MRLSDILQIVPVEIERDGEFQTLGLVSYNTSKMLVFLESDVFIPRILANPDIYCVITTRSLAPKLPNTIGVAITQNPREIFYKLHNFLATHTNFYWTDFPSEISDEAIIHPKAHIASKNIRIGRGTILESGVIVNERTIIGQDVIIRPGCIIGAHGMSYQKLNKNIVETIHAGGVQIQDRVTIEENSVISYAVFGGFTIIEQDTKIGVLVHIGHGSRIGKRCLIACGVTISGSVIISDDVWIGPGAIISHEVKIGELANVSIGSVVTKDVAPRQKVSGNFAIDHDKFIEFIKSIR